MKAAVFIAFLVWVMVAGAAIDASTNWPPAYAGGSDMLPTATGTATPAAVSEIGVPTAAYMTVRYPVRLSDPTQNIVCDYFVANWGKSSWPGTEQRPWSYQFYGRKRGLRGKWICDVSRGLEEVNGR